jgi:hypothetical protein
MNKYDSVGEGLITGYQKAVSSPVERDPDSVEQLLAQVLTQAFELKDALSNMRQQYLGPWPEPTSEKNNSIPAAPPMGLVPNMKDALYKMLDTHREIREHIAAISKGVR